VVAGSGNDTVNLFGSNSVVTGGTGNETVDAFGSRDLIQAGFGDAVINTFGDYNTVSGGFGDDTINALGIGNLVQTGFGDDTVNVGGFGDTVAAGYQGIGEAQITVGGADFTFREGSQFFADTIVGFDQPAGDRIQLTTESAHYAIAHSQQVNQGQDTLITLNDGSTILLKGISHINSGFFS
jgi:hypothetical protein